MPTVQRSVALHFRLHDHRIAEHVAVDALDGGTAAAVKTLRYAEHDAQLAHRIEVFLLHDIFIAHPIDRRDIFLLVTAGDEGGEHDLAMGDAVQRRIEDHVPAVLLMIIKFDAVAAVMQSCGDLEDL